MPFTPYHFGPNGFIGLALRKYIDIPVFVLVNVVVDIEVLVVWLFGLGWPFHRYTHTLLLGAIAGVAWGIAAYPLRHFFEKIMQALRIPYQTSFWKMAVSGVLGVWLHVVIDAIYHWDVRIFWPSNAKPLLRLISKGQVEAICIGFFIAALILYAITFILYVKQNKAEKNTQKAN